MSRPLALLMIMMVHTSPNGNDFGKSALAARCANVGVYWQANAQTSREPYINGFSYTSTHLMLLMSSLQVLFWGRNLNIPMYYWWIINSYFRKPKGILCQVWWHCRSDGHERSHYKTIKVSFRIYTIYPSIISIVFFYTILMDWQVSRHSWSFWM